MPELAEVKIMSEYINYVNENETFIGVEKSKENKNPKRSSFHLLLEQAYRPL